jgi:hypothetical protein
MNWKMLKLMSYGFKLIQDARVLFQKLILVVTKASSAPRLMHPLCSVLGSQLPTTCPNTEPYISSPHFIVSLRSVAVFFSSNSMLYPLSTAAFTISLLAAHLEFSFLFSQHTKIKVEK